MDAPVLTYQEVFTKVKTHLLKQNEKSEIFGRGVCAYRGDRDRKCAAGVLITDEAYLPEMEGKRISTMYHTGHERFRSALQQSGINDSNIHIISDLQDVHDGFPPHMWENELKRIAEKYKLQYEESANAK